MSGSWTKQSFNPADEPCVTISTNSPHPPPEKASRITNEIKKADGKEQGTSTPVATLLCLTTCEKIILEFSSA